MLDMHNMSCKQLTLLFLTPWQPFRSRVHIAMLVHETQYTSLPGQLSAVVEQARLCPAHICHFLELRTHGHECCRALSGRGWECRLAWIPRLLLPCSTLPAFKVFNKE